MDANSARLVNVAKVPAHAKRKLYTRPAGPPLKHQLVSSSGMLMMNGLVLLQPNTEGSKDISTANIEITMV